MLGYSYPPILGSVMVTLIFRLRDDSYAWVNMHDMKWSKMMLCFSIYVQRFRYVKIYFVCLKIYMFFYA